ncbi:ATP-binding protein [Streptomyces sp. NPDC006645]|uniref:HAMP domain-containing sensor histidine kinase n=1 Tax=unclassified Streptomyces TaxID=2593676 RepID=UPI0033B7C777
MVTGAIRKRIALVYGAVFLVLGGCLLTVVNLLSSAGTESEAAEIAARVVPANPPTSGNGYFLTERGELAPVTVTQLTDNVSDAASDELMFWSVGALLVMALCAVAVGWWTAGRVLRPVHAMTAKARLLSERNLHERIGATGPDDELKELGDTLDALLGRLQKAFDSQSRFIANASHELRTPLATQRTAIQVGLAGAGSPEDLAHTKEMLLDNNRRSERLIDGLLLLARSEREVEDQEEIRWGELVTEEAARHGLTATVEEPGRIRGNRALLDRLVGNLLANAQAYGKGEVAVQVSGTALTVRNNGPHIAPEEIAAFFEPFRRGEGRDRMGPGAGLGLSIVRSIVTAHGGRVTAEPGGADGGLAVRVKLPAAPGR